jgi:UDP-galactopyranose mutase
VPILLVEEPVLGAEPGYRTETHGALEVLRPVRGTLEGERIDAETVAKARAWAGARRPLVWLYSPMLLGLADAFADAPLVFDCMDDLAAFAFAPPEMRTREDELMRRANLIFAGGRTLYERRKGLGERVRLYPSGVEFEHFARAATTAPHPLFAPLGKPVFGYVGVIDERFDLELLAALADTQAEIVLAGPVVKIDPALLPRRRNVHFTGQVAYADLPAFLAGFDVALLPFARNEATANISPTKTPEYLAAGKPVVGTPVPDVVRDWGDVVAIADEPREFAAACLRAAREPDPARRALGLRRARERGWDALVDAMWDDLRALPGDGSQPRDPAAERGV